MTFVAPPGYQPVYNPTIPYVGPIYGGLRCGMSVYIQGVMHHHKHRFHVNLQCGEIEGSDIAFHFNPRFDGRDRVIFNSFQNGSWEAEEKVHDMPIKRGENFELVIIANSGGYQVNVNGREFYVFQHRMSLERVCALEIGGDVSIQTINIIGGAQTCLPGYPGGIGGGYPGGIGGSMPVYPGGSLPEMGGQPIYNPAIPYSNFIPGGMNPKRTIVVRGIVPFGANRFAINFMTGSTRDIAFHLNPRIMEGIVVRNSFLGNIWGKEERECTFFPFQEGQYFDISIRCGNERFKVFVNGQHMCDFFHRIQPFGLVDTIEVTGDVQVSYIHF